MACLVFLASILFAELPSEVNDAVTKSREAVTQAAATPKKTLLERLERVKGEAVKEDDFDGAAAIKQYADQLTKSETLPDSEGMALPAQALGAIDLYRQELESAAAEERKKLFEILNALKSQAAAKEDFDTATEIKEFIDSHAESVEFLLPSPSANTDPDGQSMTSENAAFPSNRVLLYLTFDVDEAPFGQKAVAKDVSGKNRGVVVHGATVAKGQVGNGLKFMPKDFADVSGGFPTQSAPRTIAFWVKSTRGPVKDNVHIINYGVIGSKAIFGVMEAKQKWRLFDNGGGLDSGIKVNTGWHHHAVCMTGKELVYYYDGKEVARTQRYENTKPGPMVLGGIPKNSEQRKFAGILDEIIVFDRSLSPGEIEAIYETGKSGKHIPLN